MIKNEIINSKKRYKSFKYFNSNLVISFLYFEKDISFKINHNEIHIIELILKASREIWSTNDLR